MRSYTYATKTYCIDLVEQTWKAPGRLVYMVPVERSARAGKQKMLWAAHISLVGCRLSTWRRTSRMAGWRERVDPVPCRWRRMWPLLVAVESGRWLQTRRNEKLGIVANSLLRSSAHSNVAAGGNQRAWWTNHAYSAAVEVALTLVAIAVGRSSAGVTVGVGGGGVVAASGIFHSPVRVHLLAHRTVQPRYKMVHPILVKAKLQPALHSVTTKMREWDAKLGIMWAWQAAAGSAGMSNMHVCVGVTCSPLGRWAMMGSVVGTRLVAGAVDARKWLVAPELRMAEFLTAFMSS